MINYKDLHSFFYAKYYTKTEFLIKKFLEKNCNKDKSFVIVFNEVLNYLTDKNTNENSFISNQNLKSLYLLFEKRNHLYAKNQVI